MWPFRKEIRADTVSGELNEISGNLDSQLLRAVLGGGDIISKEDAMQIPAVASCVNLICNTVAMIPFKLYKIEDETNRLKEVKGDKRVRLLNVDTGDTLDALQMKKAVVKDYLLDKGGYLYIDKTGNKVNAIRYVEASYMSFINGVDPIFKDYQINVSGISYYPYDFIKILRNTVNGYDGTSIVEENMKPIMVAWRILKFQDKLLKTGGNKKGFVKAPRRLSAEAIKALKDAWNRLFSDDSSENVVILNDGLDFQESSESSTEMQLNENVNTLTKQICQIFNVPPAMLNREVGTATEEDRFIFLQYCIQPILAAFENALNRDLLLESEKDKYKWAADLSELSKADVLKRYQAYEIASRNGFMQIDEIRFKENLPPLGIDFVKLGLQDVLYYPNKEGMTFVPNMNSVGGVELAKEDREMKKKKLEAEIDSLKSSGKE